MLNPYDQRAREAPYDVCPECGEDLDGHECRAPQPSARTLRIRALNDAVRTADTAIGALLANGQLVITRGVAARGADFVERAVRATREFRDFTAENDPYGEHDFGRIEIDGADLFWKIDYYDAELKYGSSQPENPRLTRRVLTILLAEEY